MTHSEQKLLEGWYESRKTSGFGKVRLDEYAYYWLTKRREELTALREDVEAMYRKTTDPFELMVEIRQEQIQQGEWSTADANAGYNQAVKDIIKKLDSLLTH